MIHLNRSKSRHLFWGIIFLFSFTCFFSIKLNAEKNTGELLNYQKKSLFIFPVSHSQTVNQGLLRPHRIQYLERLMQYMFVIDFKRINFYSVRSGDSIDSFLENAGSYIRKNIKTITAQRMQKDGKFKEAMVTADELVKTAQNSFALVPVINSIKRKVIRGKDYTGYSYTIHVNFHIYSTKSKDLIRTLSLDNKKSFLAGMASTSILGDGDLENLSENQRKDEKSFRSAIGGLFTVLKTQLKKMPQFKLVSTLTRVNGSTFGFDMGKNNGIKIDHRYKTFVTTANGKRKMTGFGKIRKVTDDTSDAQTLIGRPHEGDQVEEDAKVGINIVGGFGIVPLNIDIGYGPIVSGSHPCLFLAAEYELGPTMGLSELYTTFSLRIGLPKPEERFRNLKVTQIFLDWGITKKFYFRRFALNLGGYIGVHGATLSFNSYEERKGGGFGFTATTGLDVMITPDLILYGAFNIDMYLNPSKLKDENDNEIDFAKGWKWNAQGVSTNFGIKFTF